MDGIEKEPEKSKRERKQKQKIVIYLPHAPGIGHVASEPKSKSLIYVLFFGSLFLATGCSCTYSSGLFTRAISHLLIAFSHTNNIQQKLSLKCNQKPKRWTKFIFIESLEHFSPQQRKGRVNWNGRQFNPKNIEL